MRKWLAVLSLLFFASFTKAQTITQQPVNVTALAGQTATFTVAVSGGPCRSWWYGINQYGPTGTIISKSIPNITLAQNGLKISAQLYNCSGGSATLYTTTAVLTVLPAVTPPAITTDPTNQTVLFGQPATFIVAASGTAPLSYQWSKNGTVIGGAISSSYTTPNAMTADNNSTFAVTVTNSAGAITSGNAILTVSPVDKIISVMPATATIGITQLQAFTATGTYSDGSTPDLTASATWVSSTPSVATISASGVVTGVSIGTANISATFGGITGTAVLTVQNLVTVSISVLYDDASVPPVQVDINQIATNPDGTTTGVALLALTPDTTGSATGQILLDPTMEYQAILWLSGNALGNSTYPASLVLALIPQISQVNFNVVLLKSAVIPQIKSFSSGAQ